MSTQVRCLVPPHPIVEMVAYGHSSVEGAWAAVDAGAVLCLEHDVWSALSEMSGVTHTPPPSEVVRFAEELSQRGLTCRAGTAARILAVVALTEREWSDEVSAAAIAGDRDALMRLFRQAQDLFGDEASHKWSEAMSGLDANAQTG